VGQLLDIFLPLDQRIRERRFQKSSKKRDSWTNSHQIFLWDSVRERRRKEGGGKFWTGELPKLDSATYSRLDWNVFYEQDDSQFFPISLIFLHSNFFQFPSIFPNVKIYNQKKSKIIPILIIIGKKIKKYDSLLLFC